MFAPNFSRVPSVVLIVWLVIVPAGLTALLHEFVAANRRLFRKRHRKQAWRGTVTTARAFR
jgi:predicted DCC family thiol-disulfide oxidoreductase YuxK